MKHYILLSCILLSNMALAQEYWQCSLSDQDDKRWVVQHKYKRVAVNQLLGLCKQESRFPLACMSAKESCELFVHGISTRPLWTCAALDTKANVWTSKVYMTEYEAAFAAKAICKQNSSIPETCYVNLQTCKNINSRT